MRLKILMYGSIAVALSPVLSGCASTGKETTSVEPAQTPLTVLATTDLETRGLRVVRRSHTAKTTGLKVMQGIFGAIGGGVGVQTFKKEDLLGDTNEAIVNPGLDLMQSDLKKRLLDYANTHPQDLPPVTFKLKANDWRLVYKSLSDANTPYELHFSVTMEARPADIGGVPQPVVSQRCEPPVIESPIKVWEANDYAEVKRRALEFSEQCTNEFAQSFPVLFQKSEGRLSTPI